MDFDGTTTAMTFVVLVLLGVAVASATPMETTTVLVMVFPALVVYGGLMILVGVKHGEYRAKSRHGDS